MTNNNTPSFGEMFQGFQDEWINQGTQPLNLLEDFKDLQLLSQALLQQEAKRLKAKLGETHPRVVQMEASLRRQPDFIRDLEINLEIANIQVPEVGEQDALIHGRVVDQTRRGLSGLTAYLEDVSGKVLQTIRSSQSDTAGYYALPIDAAQISQLPSRGLFLVIRNQANEVLYRTSDPLQIAKGDRFFEEIVLHGKDSTESGDI